MTTKEKARANHLPRQKITISENLKNVPQI